jgi:hypothetical protein
MPSANTPPHSLPSLRTIFRLCRQYRRQQTATAYGFPFRTRLAVPDCRKDRTGTSVAQPPGRRPDAYQVTVAFSHDVGDADLRRAAAGRRGESAGILPTNSRNGCGMGNSSNLPA